MAQGYYESSEYKQNVTTNAILCILNTTLYAFKIIMC